MHSSYSYTGEELILFREALNWKRYFSSFITPYIDSKVLEAGAGLAANTSLLNDNHPTEWILLEPDKNMIALLTEKEAAHQLPSNCKIIMGTIAQLAQDKKFNTIIYIDVLEHIEDDRKEIQMAANLLLPGGRLIILAPAFNFLFSPFDKAIGHYRRYRKGSLKKIVPDYFSTVRLHYLDSAGFLMSMCNRLLLRQKYPTQKQIAFWDRYVISLSRILDKITFYSVGKTILGIWEKPITKTKLA